MGRNQTTSREAPCSKKGPTPKNKLKAKPAAKKVPNKPLLAVQGNELAYLGYGLMNIKLQEELSKSVTFADDAEWQLFVMQPNMVTGWTEGQKLALFSMWESDRLPAGFYTNLSKFDTIIVPSQHNVELFSQHHDNVHKAWLGVDRTVWHPVEREPNDKFRIVISGAGWQRKGMDVVLDVFNELALPDAELHVKHVRPYFSSPASFPHPNVVVYRGWTSEADEVALMRSADVYISASRGEGFGLIPLQAISAGIPTILTDAHGHREFAHLATHRISTTLSPATIGTDRHIGNWCEPNREELADAIRDVYRNRETYRQQAVATAPQTDTYSWANSAKQVMAAIKPTAKRVTGGWHKNLEGTAEFRVKRPIVADIGAYRIDCVPDVTYRNVNNIIEVLWETGNLVETW